MTSNIFLHEFIIDIAFIIHCKVEFYQPSCWLYSVPNFVCILAISNPVFRWESCKGSMWESVKNCLSVCKEARTCGWISQVARGCKLQAARLMLMCQACQKLKCRASCSLQDKSPRLVRPFAHSLNSQLNPVASSSH